MTVIISQKSTFWQAQYDNVTSITFANNTYSVVVGGNTYNFNRDTHLIFIIN